MAVQKGSSRTFILQSDTPARLCQATERPGVRGSSNDRRTPRLDSVPRIGGSTPYRRAILTASATALRHRDSWCRLLAHRVVSLRCNGWSAIGGSRTLAGRSLHGAYLATFMFASYRKSPKRLVG